MRFPVLIFLMIGFQAYAECRGTALIAFQAGRQEFEEFRAKAKDQVLGAYTVEDAPAADDSFGKLDFALLLNAGGGSESLVNSAKRKFKNIKALCGSERLPLAARNGQHYTARLSKFRSEAARPLAEKTMAKVMNVPSSKYGIFEKTAIHIEQFDGFDPLDDLVLFAFEKPDGRGELAKDQEFKRTEALFNKVYTTNYLYLEMKPL